MPGTARTAATSPLSARAQQRRKGPGKGEVQAAAEAAVRVLAKVRPFSPEEGATGSPLCVQANSIHVGERTFTFDMCFSGIQGAEQRPHQQDLYAHVGPDLVSCAMSGLNAAVFAYGQTGSGKTHTMMGPSTALSREADCESESATIRLGGEDAGVVPRFVADVFGAIARQLDTEECGTERTLTSYRVTARYFEVYCERAYDLLNSGAEVRVRDRGRLEGITEDVVTKPESVLALIRKGNAFRTTAATLKNARSSRSHAVFQLVFHQSIVPLNGTEKPTRDAAATEDGTGAATKGEDVDVRSLRKSLRRSLALSSAALGDDVSDGDNPENSVSHSAVGAPCNSSNSSGRDNSSHPAPRPARARTLVSTINLVDLAGSERQKQSGAEGQQFKEMVDINLSLTTLRRVMQVLSDNSALRPGQPPARVPHRDSLLTHALSTSLGGNSKAIVIVNMSPHPADTQDTLSTLEFSNIARKVVNRVHANVDESSEALRTLEEEVERLKALLRQQLAQQQQHEAPPVAATGSLGGANTREASTMTDNAYAIAEMQEKLRRTQALFGDMQEQATNYAHTNVYLLEQIRQKEDAVVALQRQVADIRKVFSVAVESRFKEHREVQQLLESVKAPLQRTAGCPQCQSALTEMFVLTNKNIALREELSLLTSSQERTYLDMERLRQKHEATVAQLADMRNQLNVEEDRQMIVAEQRRRIGQLEQQVEHHLAERVQLTMETHALQREVAALRARHTDDRAVSPTAAVAPPDQHGRPGLRREAPSPQSGIPRASPRSDLHEA